MELMTTGTINKQLAELGACAGKLKNKRQMEQTKKAINVINESSKRFAEMAAFVNGIQAEVIAPVHTEPTIVEVESHALQYGYNITVSDYVHPQDDIISLW